MGQLVVILAIGASSSFMTPVGYISHPRLPPSLLRPSLPAHLRRGQSERGQTITRGGVRVGVAGTRRTLWSGERAAIHFSTTSTLAFRTLLPLHVRFVVLTSRS
eukprot:2340765-Rhodomonas_salina.1